MNNNTAEIAPLWYKSRQFILLSDFNLSLSDPIFNLVQSIKQFNRVSLKIIEIVNYFGNIQFVLLF
jgi:hypothetical protein